MRGIVPTPTDIDFSAYAMVCQNPNLLNSLAGFFKVLAILLFLDVLQDVLSVYALPFLQSF